MSQPQNAKSAQSASPDTAHPQASAPVCEQRLNVEWWPLERPTPYARNPRVVPEAAIAKVAASLTEYGWRQPIVVDPKGVIVVGHTRLLAAQRLGLPRVPVHVASDLSPAQIKAYRLADNRTAQESGWDYELLPLEIGELVDLDYDLDILGFDADEMAAILATPTVGRSDPDEIPKPPAEPISKLGDLWQLGEHRLLCGDATSSADVTRLMDGKRAALMATDPPYLVDYDGGHHPPTQANGGKLGKTYEKGWDAYKDRAHSVEFYRDFLQTACQCALSEAPAIYQWFGMSRVEIVHEAWRQVGLLAHQVLIWRKSRAVLTYSDYLWDYEPMLYGWIAGRRPALRPPAAARAVWEIDSGIEDGAFGIHPTQKPIEVVRRPILYHTPPAGLIYEPFAGSGTALIAAEMTARCCYAVELSPVFIDVAIERWQRFTGEQAVRLG
jgi:DNA modification methylase